ncbi:MAG: histidine kinase [Bacteroidales bacterium]|jgi:signal transduction histidine kinase|nr:histidine kinase [Bacteroidales bacterium]
MKTRILLFLSFLACSFFSEAAAGDTTWILTNSGNGIRVSIANDFLHYYVPSVIKIETSDPAVPVDIAVTDGIIEKLGGNRYRVTPTTLNNMGLIVNKQYFILDVSPAPDPDVFLSGDSRRWYGVITMEDLKNSDSLIVDQSYGNFKFVSAVVTYMNNDGDLVDLFMKTTSFPKDLITKNISIDYGKLWIEKIMLKAPDGTVKILRKEVSFRIIDSYENEFVRKTVWFLRNSSDLGLMKTDLRIRIEGLASENNRKTVTDLANELNGILQTIKVKITDYQPTLRIVFDTTFSDSALIKQGFVRNSAGLISQGNNLFFPFRQYFVMYVNPNDSYYSEKVLRRSIVELLGNFRGRNMIIGKDSTIFDGANDLSSLDKNLLKLLYSVGGEYKVKQMITYGDPIESKTEVFIITLVLSICLFFLFSELFKYYGFDIRLKKWRFGLLGKLLEAALLAQIPLLAVLILLSDKFLAGDYHEADLLLFVEYFFLPFALFCTLLFAAAEPLLKRIKKTWLAAVFNLILSFTVLFISYQLVYFFISPELISLSEISWQVLLVGFLIVLYRMYIRLQSQKIAGLLQQKELELSKQKELKFKSDLNALQARINPHFLYNSLNSIASLAHSNADKTEKMALSLSKLFRYNLNKEDDMYATINDEAEMTATYLEIEKIRFEDKMIFSIDLQESLRQVKVPKFLLQPLAENAVKHGVSKLAGQGIIEIRIFEKNEKIVFEVADNGPEFPGGLMNGYGLQNVYEKLKLLYKKSFDIEFVNSPEKKVVITLNK